MTRIAVGIVEAASIAAGVRAADAMLKTAQVELLDAGAASPGKYIITVGGDVASVAAAVEAGVAEAGAQLLGTALIAHLHEQVLPAMRGESTTAAVQAVGVVETATVAAVIKAADAAAKTAVVDLLELRMARGLGGKGYVTFTGDVGSVQVGVAAAADAAARDGALVGTAVVPAPHPDLWPKLRREA
ncbi:MAG TPA: BMC domain-containing protein [Symbiobacteriaceae bacterium]|nr:BMC domain-containing protein [Symbiobacteriaceae bacterium]